MWHIISTQREEHIDQGLCFNSDEEFAPSHKYAARKFLLFMEHDDNPIETQ